MKLFVLFGQRKENYDGEYTPEALACMDEYGQVENPDYLNGELKKAEDSKDFSSLRIVQIHIDGEQLSQLLTPAPAVMKGELV